MLAVALNVEKIVKAVANSATHIAEAYNQIIKGMQDRKLRSIKIERERVRLEREELRFINDSNATMCRLLGLKNLKEMNDRTESPLVTLKIILSFYRRIKLLADYQNRGKAEFSNSRSKLDDD